MRKGKLIIFVAMLLALAGIGYLYWTIRRPIKRESTQDLFQYKAIHPDGMVELPGHYFRKVIQVRPIDLGTRSPEEQMAIWETYRTMISSLVVPISYIVQSAHVDVADYLQNVSSQLEGIDNEFVKTIGLEYLSHVQEMAESRKVRSRKYYIILKANLSKISRSDTDDDGFVGTAVNAALNAANRQQRLSDEEAETLARSELNNAIEVLYGFFQQMGIQIFTLDREGIVNMVYETFNRDLATTIRTKDVDEMEAFSLFTTSLTPELAERS
jgi:hypothetical protein